MEFTIYLIGLAALCAFVVPFLYVRFGQKKDLDRLTYLFFNQTNIFNLDVAVHDFWNLSYGIGIDRSQCKVLYLSMARPTDDVLIDLSQIAYCDEQIIKDKKGGFTNYAGLVLSDADGVPVYDLEFYSAEKPYALNNELQLLSKWKLLLREVLSCDA
ncbi:hypothetical protein E1176_06175 [Fulvivirga sp. RKSG066]|uniref:hypothetical protein n=1 Tax=Fulvivirga aurantia TaxID=2529383 RepID=UPI0012BCF1C9|nr:hypothetical protein [Fulvivirga aurantia]MTI20601.1 hypothetical protein [Fulvivirga aurantia]